MDIFCPTRKKNKALYGFIPLPVLFDVFRETTSVKYHARTMRLLFDECLRWFLVS